MLVIDLKKLCNNNRTAGTSAHLFVEMRLDYGCMKLLLTQTPRLSIPSLYSCTLTFQNMNSTLGVKCVSLGQYECIDLIKTGNNAGETCFYS